MSVTDDQLEAAVLACGPVWPAHACPEHLRLAIAACRAAKERDGHATGHTCACGHVHVQHDMESGSCDQCECRRFAVPPRMSAITAAVPVLPTSEEDERAIGEMLRAARDGEGKEGV